MQWAIRAFLAALLLIAPAVCETSAAPPPMFATQQAAQQHCPNDTVVWLNTKTGIYHMPNTRWYGKTRDGAFVCLEDAPGRPAQNGQ
jgi:hypothetical protein